MITSFFVTLVFGMIDLSLALFRKHVASEAARQGARIATVHGYLAPAGSTMNAWGPTPSYYPALHRAIGLRELQFLHGPGGRSIG